MAIALTRELLQALTPRPSGSKGVIWDAYVKALTSDDAAILFHKFGVTTKLRMVHWLAQVSHESGGFSLIWESGSYSAKRITQIFGVGKHSARVTETEAKKLAYNGPALFDRVYGIGNPDKARELGNREKGDGWRYRGCGVVQLTGRWAHETYAAKIGCPVNELEAPLNSIHGALLEWEEKGCNAPADKDDILAVTKKINGGRNGLADRRHYYAKAKKLVDGLPEEKKKPKLVAAPVPPEEVAMGDSNANVKELQELLVRAGYVVPVDDKMGPRTEAALAGFQVNHALPATGVGDMETLEALRAVKPIERQVDVKTLSETSRIMQLGQTLQSWFSWGYRGAWGGVMGVAGYLGFGEESNPLEVVDKASATAQKANDLAAQLNLPVGFTDWRVWAFVALIAIGVICFFGRSKAKGIVAARIDDAQTGANLSA
jgi:putative chitinase